TSFSLSRERALALQPATDVDLVTDLQAEVSEAWRLLDSRADISLGGAHDIRQAVTRTSLGGMLDTSQLLDVLSTLECADRIRSALSRLMAEEYPWLSYLRTRIGSFREVIALISQTVSAQGEIMDSASPALGRIRSELRTAHQRLIDRLQSILNSQTYRTAIQEPIITIRNGRYVIPVRSDARGVIRGAIHDHSSSGATLYVEPFQTNDLNNRWRELQLQEQEEIERILQFISERIAVQAPAMLETVEGLASLDLALAKARFGAAMRAVLPTVHSDGALSLVNARHPLLTGPVVPISVRLGEDFRQLLVTGPNTGGKTVALKTVGLLTLMAQSGLPVPADPGSRVAVFDGIFADIGDEQSIAQSLSTFSGHLTNIIRVLDEMTPNSLLLLDELGAGTDPAEGSALARSLLTYLLKTQARVMATTHYSELKAFASTTEGVENASVEFDVETLTPTYRLSIGLPGRSNALAIASRLGLRDEIIQGSKEFISSEEARVETMLARIARDREDASALFASAGEAQRDALTLRSRLEREVESVLQERENILKLARSEAQASLEDLRRELDRAEAELRLNGNAAQPVLAGLRNRIERATEQQAPLLAAPPTPEKRTPVVQPVAPLSDRGIQPGDRVTILRTGQEGTVTAVPPGRNELEVQIGPFKTRVKVKDVRYVGPGADIVEENRYAGGTRIQRSEGPAPSMEFDMRGWRVDEVIHELERYINDAYMSNMPFVRIIHGKGTGALRQVVREELATNPLVSSFRPAEAREGGEGVTVAQLSV
ncbi:MAG: endonuclease MutS2, partial [Chloroflexi bacterium]|nr:endonuclease MutS2 [Chloroflexota bacterium]